MCLVELETFAWLLTDDGQRLLETASHALADADGYVRAPDIDMSSQMTQLIMAQRGYQSSVQTTKFARDAYDAALAIGNRR